MNANKRIWLIGGTQESAQLAAAIASTDLPCTVSVTTATAQQLYPAWSVATTDEPARKVWVGRLNETTIADFLNAENVGVVLDASHPYAVEISELAIATANRFDLPYLRFERPVLSLDPEQLSGTENIYPDFATLLASDRLLGQRVLLIVGYRPLALFQPWQAHATLFARLLPSTIAIDAAIAAGFTPDRLFAMRPPISAELEKALWRQWDISVVVTKSSGTAGGEDVKRQVAAELEVPLIAIARPPMVYPQQTSDLKEALKFCRQYLA